MDEAIPGEDPASLALRLMRRALEILDGSDKHFEAKARLQEAIDALIATGPFG